MDKTITRNQASSSRNYEKPKPRYDPETGASLNTDPNLNTLLVNDGVDSRRPQQQQKPNYVIPNQGLSPADQMIRLPVHNNACTEDPVTGIINCKIDPVPKGYVCNLPNNIIVPCPEQQEQMIQPFKPQGAYYENRN